MNDLCVCRCRWIERSRCRNNQKEKTKTQNQSINLSINNNNTIITMLFGRLSACSTSKWCSHITTSELSSVWARVRAKGKSAKPPVGIMNNNSPNNNKCLLMNRRYFSVHGSTGTKSLGTIQQKYLNDEKISMITAYDYTSAKLCDDAGFDILLVGDSLGMVQLGYDGTEQVTMCEMLHHCKSVSRTANDAFLIGDMPFGSYLTVDDSLKNACRLIKESGMHAIKLEGGKRVVDKVSAIVDAGIPVQGHIGLTPQTANALGGYKVQGRTAQGAIDVYEDAMALQEAGCFSIVLECVPEKVAMEITNALDIPTIGIGAGRHTSGQVQVFHDVTGLYDRLKPKFAKRYTNAAEVMAEALNGYREETEMGKFPADEHVFKIKKSNFQEFREAVGISSYQELHYDLIQEQLVELEQANA